MKIFSRITVVFLIFVLLFTSVSCNRRVERQTGLVAEDYQPQIAGEITVSCMAGSAGEDPVSISAMVAAFEKQYPRAKVFVDSTLTRENTATRISANDIGDVFFTWERDVYSLSQTHRALMRLDAYAQALKIDLSNIYSGTMKLGYSDGNMYMVARDHTHVMLYYNKTMVKEANLEIPQNDWTWDDFKYYCEALTKIGDDGKYTQIGAQLDFTYAPIIIPFLEGFGGQWLDTETKTISLVSDPLVLKGVTEMIEFMELGYIYPTGANATMASRYSKVVGKRSAICFYDGVFPGISSIGSEYQSLQLEWDCITFPALPTARVGTGATGFVVYNGTSNPDTAAAFALYLYTEDGQRAYNGQEDGSVPNVRSLAEDDFWRRPYDTSEINYDAFVYAPDADTVGLFESLVPSEVAELLTSSFASLMSAHWNGRSYIDTLTSIEQMANERWEALL